MTTEFFIFGLARLTRIFHPSTDSETSLKVMRYWKFSQKTKLKQKFFTNSEKEVGNFFKTGTMYSCILRTGRILNRQRYLMSKICHSKAL